MTNYQNTSLPPKRVQLIEVSVFLLLIVPSMALSFLGIEQVDLTFIVVAIASILQNLALLSLILFFVWRNGEPFEWIGLTSQNSQREILVGIGLFFPFVIGAGLLERALRGIGFTGPESPPAFLIPSGSVELLLALVFLVVVAVSEEVIFRGYLIRRFQALTQNPMAAVLLSAAIFAIGHGYQGPVGMITVAVMGLAFALIYLWRGSLTAPIVMHFLQNFMGIFVAPLMNSIVAL